MRSKLSWDLGEVFEEVFSGRFVVCLFVCFWCVLLCVFRVIFVPWCAFWVSFFQKGACKVVFAKLYCVLCFFLLVELG
jgi:hypothetical protein